MMIVSCPSCGTKGNIPDSAWEANARIKCPQCGTKFMPQPTTNNPSLPIRQNDLAPREASLAAPPRVSVPPSLPAASSPSPRLNTPDSVIDLAPVTHWAPVQVPASHEPHSPPILTEISASKECPFCAERIMMNAKKCRYCGEMLDPALRAAEEAKRIAMAARDRNHQQIVNVNTNVVNGSDRPRRMSALTKLGLITTGVGFLVIAGGQEQVGAGIAIAGLMLVLLAAFIAFFRSLFQF